MVRSQILGEGSSTSGSKGKDWRGGRKGSGIKGSPRKLSFETDYAVGSEVKEPSCLWDCFSVLHFVGRDHYCLRSLSWLISRFLISKLRHLNPSSKINMPLFRRWGYSRPLNPPDWYLGARSDIYLTFGDLGKKPVRNNILSSIFFLFLSLSSFHWKTPPRGKTL